MDLIQEEPLIKQLQWWGPALFTYRLLSKCIDPGLQLRDLAPLNSLLLWTCTYLQYCSIVSWQSIASLDSGLDLRFSIHAQIENPESRTNHQESSWGLSLAGQKTKDSSMTDFSIILYGCNTTRHGYTVDSR